MLTDPSTAASPWIRQWDKITQTPWLFNPESKTFISYDDPESIGIKTDYAISKNLGGLMVWSVDEDNGELLEVAAKILKGTSSSGSKHAPTTTTKKTHASSSATASTAPKATATTGAHAACDAKKWSATTTYNGGDQVVYKKKIYKAAWWTKGDKPGSSDVWTAAGNC